MDKTSRQRIRYLRTVDGVRLAWAEAGQGALLIKASNWLTHLEYDWESPVWRHWLRFFADHFRFVRSDERGCGMTDWSVGDLSFERWVQDRSEEHTSELQSPCNLVCRLLLEKKKKIRKVEHECEVAIEAQQIATCE